jgi:hypothetical protein
MGRAVIPGRCSRWAVMFAVTAPVGQDRPAGHLLPAPGPGVSLRTVTARRSCAARYPPIWSATWVVRVPVVAARERVICVVLTTSQRSLMPKVGHCPSTWLCGVANAYAWHS